jgi:flagellar biosynthesis/type III secretory pathway protein FliH
LESDRQQGNEGAREGRILEQEIASRGGGASGALEVFKYPACPGAAPIFEGFAEAHAGGFGSESTHSNVQGGDGGAANGAGSQRAAEEMRRSLDAERSRGREEGRHMEREAQAAARKAEEVERKRQLARLVEVFGHERDKYLQAVESEVVKLALAVAARVLRREAQMDPLLLSGAVRVALGQLAGSTEVVLRVPVAEVELWKEAIALIPNLQQKPAVMAGEGMRLGDCVIESKVGSVDLGVRSQLVEIERGFFDRAGARSGKSEGSAEQQREPEEAQP